VLVKFVIEIRTEEAVVVDLCAHCLCLLDLMYQILYLVGMCTCRLFAVNSSFFINTEFSTVFNIYLFFVVCIISMICIRPMLYLLSNWCYAIWICCSRTGSRENVTGMLYENGSALYISYVTLFGYNLPAVFCVVEAILDAVF